MALKHFRRFKYAAADVDRVIKHLKLHDKVTENDIITRQAPALRQEDAARRTHPVGARGST